MAIKYILVPEDMYKGLISASSESENINLDFTKNKLEKIKKHKSNPSTKNILYNQELRRYLKLKKEADDKPFKVELKNGAKILTKNQSPTFVTSTPIQTRRNFRGLLQTDDPNLDETVVEFSENPENYSTTAEGSNSFISPKYERVEKMLNIISKNPEKFNISDGQILKGHKPITGSNVVKSVDRILNRNTDNMPSPPGTTTLQNKILKDPEAFALFKQTPPPKVNPRRTGQLGKGFNLYKKKNLKRKIISKNISKNELTSNFTPKLWN